MERIQTETEIKNSKRHLFLVFTKDMHGQSRFGRTGDLAKLTEISSSMEMFTFNMALR